MRITRVVVQNFRSIKSADLDLTAFNVFAGQNNHGKTNLFEAIEWFYNGGGDIRQLAYCRDPRNEISVEIKYGDIQAGIESIRNEATREKFRKFAGGKNEIVVKRTSVDSSKRFLWDEGEWKKNFAGFDNAFNDCLPRLQYVSTATRLAEVSKWGKKTPIGEMLSGVLNAILETSQPYQQFRETFHQLFTGETSEVKVELDTLAGKVKVHLEQQFPECTKIEFGVTAPVFDDLLKSFETSVNDGIETSAEEKGDGMQRALMLAIIKTYSDYRREKDELGKRFLFLIDEAELHLHPTAQRQLKRALADLSANGDQVLVNTHSSVLVADDAEEQSLWKVVKRDGATTVTPISQADKPDLIYELLGGSPADLLFPRNFLIVEGASEEAFIRRVAQRFYANYPDLRLIRAEGDHDQQRRSMHAINVAFTPLFHTPVYRERFVVLCDNPSEQRKGDFEHFLKCYASLHQSGQIIVSPHCSFEEGYPDPWRKTAEEVRKMQPREKTDLACAAGDAITKEQFEHEMPSVFNALRTAWGKAYR